MNPQIRTHTTSRTFSGPGMVVPLSSSGSIAADALPEKSVTAKWGPLGLTRAMACNK